MATSSESPAMVRRKGVESPQVKDKRAPMSEQQGISKNNRDAGDNKSVRFLEGANDFDLEGSNITGVAGDSYTAHRVEVNHYHYTSSCMSASTSSGSSLESRPRGKRANKTPDKARQQENVDMLPASGGYAVLEETPVMPPLPIHRSCDIYRRHLATKGRGIPLWIPEPSKNLAIQYQRKGVSIGDVGIVTASGSFTFLFNIYLPKGHPINPQVMPQGYEPLPGETMKLFPIASQREFKENSYLASASSVRARRNGDSTGFIFELSEHDGAILTMPVGCMSEDLVNINRFQKYVTKNLKSWYTYAHHDLDFILRNGDLRVVRGCDKTSAWGMATFFNSGAGRKSRQEPNPLKEGEGGPKCYLEFGLINEDRTSEDGKVKRYGWECSGMASSEVRAGPDVKEILELRRGDVMEEAVIYENQCLFVRTLNATLSNKVWDELGLEEEDGEEEDEEEEDEEEEKFNENHSNSTDAASNSAPSLSSSSFVHGGSANGGAGTGPSSSMLASQSRIYASRSKTRKVSIADEYNAASASASVGFLADHPSMVINEFLLKNCSDDTIMASTTDDVWMSVVREDDCVLPSSDELLERIMEIYTVREEDGVVFLDHESEVRDQRGSAMPDVNETWVKGEKGMELEESELKVKAPDFGGLGRGSYMDIEDNQLQNSPWVRDDVPSNGGGGLLQRAQSSASVDNGAPVTDTHVNPITRESGTSDRTSISPYPQSLPSSMFSRATAMDVNTDGSPYITNFDLVPPSPPRNHADLDFDIDQTSHSPFSPPYTAGGSDDNNNPHTPSYNGSYYNSPYSQHSELDFSGEDINFDILSDMPGINDYEPSEYDGPSASSISIMHHPSSRTRVYELGQGQLGISQSSQLHLSPVPVRWPFGSDPKAPNSGSGGLGLGLGANLSNNNDINSLGLGDITGGRKRSNSDTWGAHEYQQQQVIVQQQREQREREQMERDQAQTQAQNTQREKAFSTHRDRMAMQAFSFGGPSASSGASNNTNANNNNNNGSPNTSPSAQFLSPDAISVRRAASADERLDRISRSKDVRLGAAGIPAFAGQNQGSYLPQPQQQGMYQPQQQQGLLSASQGHGHGHTQSMGGMGGLNVNSVYPEYSQMQSQAHAQQQGASQFLHPHSPLPAMRRSISPNLGGNGGLGIGSEGLGVGLGGGPPVSVGHFRRASSGSRSDRGAEVWGSQSFGHHSSGSIGGGSASSAVGGGSGHLSVRRLSPYPSPNASPRVRYEELQEAEDDVVTGLGLGLVRMGTGMGNMTIGGLGMVGMTGYHQQQQGLYQQQQQQHYNNNDLGAGGGGPSIGVGGLGLGIVGPEIGEPPVSAGYSEEVAITGRGTYRDRGDSRSRDLSRDRDDGSSGGGRRRAGSSTLVGNGAPATDAQENLVDILKQVVTTGRTANASVRRRKQDANFACTVPGCNSTFTRGFNLKGHLRSHYEQKPYKCHWPGCGKGFARQHDCKRHEQLHSNFQPFECEGCKKQFARMDALNRHLRSEAGAECARVVEKAREGGALGTGQNMDKMEGSMPGMGMSQDGQHMRMDVGDDDDYEDEVKPPPVVVTRTGRQVQRRRGTGGSGLGLDDAEWKLWNGVSL